MTETTGFFEVLMGQSDDEAKTQEVELARRSLEREFQALHDQYAGDVLRLEKSIASKYNALRQNPSGGLNAQALVEAKINLAAATEYQAAVAAEIAYLFGS